MPAEPEPALVTDAETVFEVEPHLVPGPQSRVVLDPGVVFQPHDDQAPAPQETPSNRKALVDALLQLAKLLDPDPEPAAIKQQHSSSGVRTR